MLHSNENLLFKENKYLIQRFKCILQIDHFTRLCINDELIGATEDIKRFNNLQYKNIQSRILWLCSDIIIALTISYPIMRYFSSFTLILFFSMIMLLISWIKCAMYCLYFYSIRLTNRMRVQEMQQLCLQQYKKYPSRYLKGMILDSSDLCLETKIFFSKL